MGREWKTVRIYTTFPHSHLLSGWPETSLQPLQVAPFQVEAVKVCPPHHPESILLKNRGSRDRQHGASPGWATKYRSEYIPSHLQVMRISAGLQRLWASQVDLFLKLILKERTRERGEKQTNRRFVVPLTYAFAGGFLLCPDPGWNLQPWPQGRCSNQSSYPAKGSSCHFWWCS